MIIKKIIAGYLKNYRYDGLFGEECGCENGDLFPCGEIPSNCEPGHKIPCDCEKNCGWHIGKS
jgi:hypothetical protein